MGLEDHELRTWVQRVAYGEASRWQFLRAMLGLGLSGPLLADLGSAILVSRDLRSPPWSR